MQQYYRLTNFIYSLIGRIFNRIAISLFFNLQFCEFHIKLYINIIRKTTEIRLLNALLFFGYDNYTDV